MKRTLKTYIIQENDQIDAKQLFKDLKDVVEKDKKLGIEIDRKHPAQKLLNKFSGQYISPTMVRGFYNCAANQIYNSLLPYDSTRVTSVGTTVHSILQEFYEADGPLRTIELLDSITDKYCQLNHEFDLQRNQVKFYINGFKETPHYLTGNPMDHKNLICFNELFIKEKCSPLGISIPLTIYNAIDRVDFNEDGIYSIDYKTGKYFSPEVFSFDGYLPQLISYAWGIEAAYGEKVKKAYILTPGFTKKYHEMDIHNLKFQSMYIEKLLKYCDDAAEAAETRIYKESIMPYCSSCGMKELCNIYNRKLSESQKIEIEYDITLSDSDEKNDDIKDFLGAEDEKE